MHTASSLRERPLGRRSDQLTEYRSVSGDRPVTPRCDVAGKGIPAALLMATTHSVLRAEAYRLISPGAVLARVNAQLVQEMPPGMFVTCFYLVLDPSNGRLRYANAGRCLPYRRTDIGVVELDARGMPLGLMPDVVYEEHDTGLAPATCCCSTATGWPRPTTRTVRCSASHGRDAWWRTIERVRR